MRVSPVLGAIWQDIFRRYSLRPFSDGDPELAAAGRAIYEGGEPDSNIVACAACHGPNAEGVRGLAQRLFPGSWEEVPSLGKIHRFMGLIDRMRPNQVGERQGSKREGE